MSLEECAVIYAALTLAAAIFTLVLTAVNAAWMLRTSTIRPIKSGPLVSVLVPARDEEENIEACLDSLLAQNYRNLEIIVYDDDSSDGTGAILDRYRRSHPDHVKVIHGKGLAEGWYGKPQALMRLSQAAAGDWLYMTDADTVHRPDSVGFSLSLAQRYGADLVSGYVRQKLGGFGEAQVVPAIYLLSMVAMPLGLVHLTKTPRISHAIGQSMLFRKSAYDAIGGYAAVKNKVSEDVQIARLMKKHGGKALFADLKERVSCRMYRDYRSAIVGLSKNVYDYFNKNIYLLIAATAGVTLLFFLPIAASLWLPPCVAAAQPYFRLGCLVMVYAWYLLTMERMLPWYIPLIYPLILTNVLSTAWRAARLFATGKAVEWKGRMVK